MEINKNTIGNILKEKGIDFNLIFWGKDRKEIKKMEFSKKIKNNVIKKNIQPYR